MNKTRIAIFASGSGSNALRLMEHFNHNPSAEVVLLLSNKIEAGALKHAADCGVPHLHFTNAEFRSALAVVESLHNHSVDIIVLAGFLLLIPHAIIEAYPDKIVNIHPALLPKYGGKGMYGHFVHEAVAAAGETESGITIHLVNSKYDEGRVLEQFRVALGESPSPASIEAKVRQLELQHFAPTIEQWITSLKA
jgi:phosphoribosylglycinamide formyltransferase 1